MPIRCDSCEEYGIICDSWYTFFEHCYIAHPTQRELIRQLPFNLSGRTRKQIVKMAEETYLKEWII